MIKFKTPTDCGLYELSAGQKSAFNFVESKIESLELDFEVPYQIAQHEHLIRIILSDSGWKLVVTTEGKTRWKIEPK